MLRDDELHSWPLRVGQRPELPSLRSNPYWKHLMHRCDPYSVSPVSSERVYVRMADLSAWNADSSFSTETGLVVTDFPYDQFSADPQRAVRGEGSSSCTYLQAQGGVSFLLGDWDLSRQDIAAKVNAYDSSGRRCDGSFISSEYTLCAAEHAVPLKLIEGDPEDPLSVVDSEDAMLNCLLHLHAALMREGLGCRAAIAVGTVKIGSTGVGNVMGILVHHTAHDKVQVEFIDTHGRTDYDGERLGMVQASISADTIEVVFRDLVHWFWTWHLRKAGCKPPMEVVGAIIDWKEEAHQDVENPWHGKGSGHSAQYCRR